MNVRILWEFPDALKQSLKSCIGHQSGASHAKSSLNDRFQAGTLGGRFGGYVESASKAVCQGKLRVSAMNPGPKAPLTNCSTIARAAATGSGRAGTPAPPRPPPAPPPALPPTGAVPLIRARIRAARVLTGWRRGWWLRVNPNKRSLELRVGAEITQTGRCRSNRSPQSDETEEIFHRLSDLRIPVGRTPVEKLARCNATNGLDDPRFLKSTVRSD
jgi:hypothetical protein